MECAKHFCAFGKNPRKAANDEWGGLMNAFAERKTNLKSGMGDGTPGAIPTGSHVKHNWLRKFLFPGNNGHTNGAAAAGKKEAVPYYLDPEWQRMNSTVTPIWGIEILYKALGMDPNDAERKHELARIDVQNEGMFFQRRKVEEKPELK